MKMNRIFDYLDEILPNAKCELNYTKDYELLIAVMLSAQTTDKRVNEVTVILFNKYDNKCVKCGWGETNIHTGNIPLEVEHIDGNAENSSPENVTLLCPNCHSLTKTYKGANKGHGRKKTWIPKTE